MYMKRLFRSFVFVLILTMSVSTMQLKMIQAADVQMSTFVDRLFIPSNKLDAGDTITVEIRVRNEASSTKEVRVNSIEFEEGFTPVDNASLGYDLSPGSESLIIRQLKYRGGSNNRTISYTIEYTEKNAQGGTTNVTGKISGSRTIDESITVVDTTKYQPRVTLVNDEIIELGAGQTKAVKLPIINAGGFAARNLTITIETIKDGGQVPILIRNAEKLYYTSFPTKQVNYLDFSVQVDRTAKAGLYPIKIKYKYTNTSDDKFEGEDTIYVRVMNVEMPARLQFGLKAGNPIIPGKSGTIEITARNQGQSTANNVEIVLSGLKKEGLSVVGGSSVGFIPAIEPGSTASVTFQLGAAASLKGSVEQIEVEYAYADGTSEAQTGKQQVFVPLDGKEFGIADLTVENISISKNEIGIGEDVNLGFTVVNHSQYDAENVKITLSGGDILRPKTQSVISLKELKAGERKSYNSIFGQEVMQSLETIPWRSK